MCYFILKHKAKLSILTEYDKAIKEMILDLIKLRKGSLNWNVSDYEEVFSINDLNSILSKIGDNSEVKE
jgi:hypothetical protein